MRNNLQIKSRILWAALVVCRCVFLQAGAGAPSLAPALFHEVHDVKSAVTPAPDPFAQRSRRVQPDFSVVNRLLAAKSTDETTVLLNLFADLQVEASVKLWPQSGCASRIFRGRFVGVEDGVVLIAVRTNTIAATVIVPEISGFKIQPIRDGSTLISEIASDRSPLCGTAPSVPTAIGRLDLGNIGKLSPSVSPTPPYVADLLVVYSTDARLAAGGTEGMETIIDLAIAEANTCYVNSQINLRVNLAHVAEVNYAETGNLETDLVQLEDRFDGVIDEVHDLRTQFQADFVTLIVEREDSNAIAGIASVMTAANAGFAEYAFNVLRRPYVTGNFTLAHELGHNMGCAHDRDNSPVLGSYSYSFGLRFTAGGTTYRTVMATKPGLQIPYFSNPEILFLGSPTGIPSDTTNSANNAQTINLNAPLVTSFLASPPRIEFARSQFTVLETAGAAVITLHRSGDISATASATVALTSTTATPAASITFPSTTLVFATGEVDKPLSIPVLDNAVPDGDRSFTFSIVSISANAIWGSNTNLVLTARDDETPWPSSLDFSFDAGTGPNYWVDTLAVQTNGMVLVGGGFNAINGLTRNRIARLQSDGSPDLSYDPGRGAKYRVICSVLEPDQTWTLAGEFNQVTAVDRGRIARVDTSGQNVPAFDPGTGANDFVFAMAASTNLGLRKIILGGRFTTLNDISRNRIGRLNNDGSVDQTFDPGIGPNDMVQSVAVQPNGKILIAGRFTQFGTTNRNRIARLNTDGILDVSFDPGAGADAPIFTLAVQADGKILAAGAFTNFNGVPKARLARLNSNGSLDTSFPNVSVNDLIQTLVIQPDGRILLGGDFTTMNGVRRIRVARLNADASLDESFNIGDGPNNTVSTLAVQDDGKVLIGGLFTQVDGMDRPYIARLLPNNPPISPRITNFARSPDGQVTLNVQGQFGRIFVLQHSDDLRQWNSIRTNSISGSNSVFSVTTPRTNTARFYRILQTTP